MNILIVESKAKCLTILKHLGRDDWRVLATGGHVETLPFDRSIHDPKQVKKGYWGSRSGALPEPPWVWTERGEKALDAIKAEAAKHDDVHFYLASDPDREGERISWHLARHLSGLGRCDRVTFQEITKPAVLDAVAHPRTVDLGLVNAALVRAFIDRLMGWRSKNIARAFVKGGGASMGRVQTPTLGFVVARELEREAHVPIPYFEVRAATALGDWQVRFHEPSADEVWRGDNGKSNPQRTSNRTLANTAHEAIAASAGLEITSVVPHKRSQSPKAPFRTDTLLRATSSRWSWSPKKTSKLASDLYEAGHITYIRTDSTRISDEAVTAGREAIEAAWGPELVGALPVKDPAAKGVQDAHEAIRPSNLKLGVLPGTVDADARKLYALIRARTLASLMISSIRSTLSLQAKVEGLDVPIETSVGWYTVPGWRRAFDGLDATVDTTPAEVVVGSVETLLPADEDRANPLFVEDATKPPGRYSAATLIKKMRDSEIGRPSTYSTTIDKLEQRGYVVDESGLCPTESGRRVWLDAAPLYVVGDGEEVFDVAYTARLEGLLDEIANEGRSAPEAWEQLRDAFNGAHAHAQAARASGKLTPRNRRHLSDFLAASPTHAAQIGDLDELTEANGRLLLAELRGLGIELLPTEKQQGYLDKLLESGTFTVESAVAEAELVVSNPLTRNDVSALIEFLRARVDSDQPASDKQLRFIADLAKKADLDEADACALVECALFTDLRGGRGGSASRLIEQLKARRKPKDPKDSQAPEETATKA